VVKKTSVKSISSARVREDFNDLRAVVHYTRAAHQLGLWASEQKVFSEHLPKRKTARVLEAGCGAGRVALGLHELGYKKIHAFDFAEELCAQAQSLFIERKVGKAITLFHADARKIAKHPEVEGIQFDAALFMFNGLMQIPHRRNRRAALRSIGACCKPGAPLIFTTHDRDHSKLERFLWKREAKLWLTGQQDPALVEFGDRYFEDDLGCTFMHLPNREEILEDLKATGWTHTWDSMRRRISKESRAVREFSDECRFWVASRG
jgi:SAM-dependent methyltransferase